MPVPAETADRLALTPLFSYIALPLDRRTTASDIRSDAGLASIHYLAIFLPARDLPETLRAVPTAGPLLPCGTRVTRTVTGPRSPSLGTWRPCLSET